MFCFWDIFFDFYELDLNLNGYVSFGVVENVLFYDILYEYIYKNLNFDINDFMYGDGKKVLWVILVNFFNKCFNFVLLVELVYIVVMNGCIVVIEYFGWVFGNLGDGFFLGCFYYGVFVIDIILCFGNDFLMVDFDD